MPLSPKQVKSYVEATKRFCIWVGAVRSGKTYSSILKLIDLLKTGPKGDIMIIGVNRSTIQRNVLNELYKFLGAPPPSTKTTETKLYGRNVYFVGAHDEGAVRTIQGATLSLAYVDEATCIPAPFWRMLISRLSVKGSQLLATCNPEGPVHWLKKEYIDRASEHDLVYWNFNLDDNPALDEDYKKSLKTSYTGMWYKRYIMGEWAAAHGLIYDSFDYDNIYENPYPAPVYYIAGIDYGTSNATAAVLCAVTPYQWPQLRIEEEYYYDSVVKGRQKSDDELAQDIYRWLSTKNLRAIYVDPSAASLKVELRNRNLPILDANNDVLPGIRTVAKFINGKNLVIHKSCRTLIEVIQTYSWDPKAADRGEDAPLKKREHICFAAGTPISTILGKRNIEDLFIGDEVWTRNGLRKIIANGYRKAEVYEFFIGNKSIKCTKDHPFFTVNRGWINSFDLIQSDILIAMKDKKICQNMEKQKKLSGMAKPLDDIQILQLSLKKDILNPKENISIGLFGNPTMEQSQKNIISITSTKTHLTIIYPIWNVYLSSNIQKDIQRIVFTAFQTDAGNMLLNGINPILGKNGIEKKLLEKDLVNGNQSLINVNFVKSIIRQKSDLKSNFVRIIVNPNTEENLELTMSLETALTVLKSSKSINTLKQNIAQKAVPRKKLYRQLVFNISVDEDKEYFANDILVSNCDALRYLIYSAFPTGEFNHPDENLTIEQIRRKVYGEEPMIINPGMGGYI